MTDQIDDILRKSKIITLQQMQNIRLMDRIDSKFVAPVSRLPLLLSKMEPYFMVQLHNEQTVASYSTQYLDTEELDMYLMHQNGKLNRQKVRIRSYVESELSFLEIKNKNNKGRTKKIRVPVSYSHISSVQDLDTKETFWENSLFHRQNLSPSLSNTFKRITLVNNRKTERVTIDFDLEFHNHRLGNCEAVEQLMILELKQDGWQHSDFRDILQDMRIKQSSFSKYCIGTVLTNPHVKYNRFKKKQILITKLLENDSIGNGC